MKKYLLFIILSLNSFSNYYMINYKGRYYKAFENENNAYTTIKLNRYKRSLLNRYVQKYKVIRRLNNEEIRDFNCNYVYSKCK